MKTCQAGDPVVKSPVRLQRFEGCLISSVPEWSHHTTALSLRLTIPLLTIFWHWTVTIPICSKIEEFIDVERTQTPQKKLCRNNNGNTSGCHVQNPKWSRQPNNNPKNSVRAESQKTAKRGCQPKWKRKLEKNGDGIDGKERMTRKRKVC